MSKRERIDIKPGDRVRCPDRCTATWRFVVRVGRRRDGTRYIILRRSRLGRAFGLPLRQPIEWAQLKALGYGIRRARATQANTVQVSAAAEQEGEVRT